MKLSLLTFGDHIADPHSGALMTAHERHRMIVEAAAAADACGWWGVNVGEHHAGAFVLSSPPVLLSAIAERTKHLRLGTAVALGANLDPLRLAEDYATLDVLSGGRAEVVVGRGTCSPTPTPSSGRISRTRERCSRRTSRSRSRCGAASASAGPPSSARRSRVSSSSRLRSRPHVPLWIGGGGSPETAELAARLGLPLALPSAFSDPARFVPVVETYRERFAAHGHSDREPKGRWCWHMNVTRNSQDAKRRWEPRYRLYCDWFAAQVKAQNPGYTPHGFDYEWLLTDGPAIAGSPAEAAERLQRFSEILGTDTHLVYLDMGGMPQAELIEMVELVGSEVLPALETPARAVVGG